MKDFEINYLGILYKGKIYKRLPRKIKKRSEDWCWYSVVESSDFKSFEL